MPLWLVHTGKHGEYEDHMIKNNVIIIGWHDIPNLSEIKDKKELETAYRQVYGAEKPSSISARVAAIWNFRTKINKGDLVASPLKGKSEIIIGEVVGEYEYQNLESNVKHTRKVNWLKTFPRSLFDTDIQNSLGAHLTVSQVRMEDAEERIRHMLNDYSWIKFYSEFAERLLQYKDNRKPLVKEIHRIYKIRGLNIMTDKFKDGIRGPIRDIDPFTVFSIFNRGLTWDNRHDMADRLAQFLGVSIPAPARFVAIPIMFNKAYWFMPFADKRDSGHIDALWNVFADALAFTYDKNDSSRDKFVESFNRVLDLRSPAYKITIGLYWIRPYQFLPLDSQTRKFLEKQKYQFPEELRAEEYLRLQNTIRSIFDASDIPVRSFPELSRMAYSVNLDSVSSEQPEDSPVEFKKCRRMLDEKLQMIFYGPPGTGKTYTAYRLATHIVRDKSDSKFIRCVTFHPSYSYEEFVEGLKPDPKGNYSIQDGIFKKICADATKNPSHKYVLVIDEINRGRTEKIFGELITLIEGDKRDTRSAHLAYSQKEFTVPENLLIVGTMNTADRSLTYLDAALRRRFGFVEMMPDYSLVQNTIQGVHLDKLLKELNSKIREHGGREKQIGHSYFMSGGKPIQTAGQLQSAFVHDIIPLLQDYFYEDYDKLNAILGDAFVDKKNMEIKDLQSDSAFADALRKIYDGDSRDKRTRDSHA